jgi:hypothetical protein
MVEIVGDIRGAMLAFDRLGNSVPRRAEAASTARSSLDLFDEVSSKFSDQFLGKRASKRPICIGVVTDVTGRIGFVKVICPAETR